MLKTITRRNFWVMICADTLLIVLSFYFSYLIRFDGSIPPRYFSGFTDTVCWVVPLKLICLLFFGAYKGMWRYTGIYDLENLIKACVVSSAVIVSVLVITVRFAGFPRSVFIIDFLLTFLFISGARVVIRLFLIPGHTTYLIPFLGKTDPNGKKILVVGAGSAGEKLLREIRENPEIEYNVVGCIDDDEAKHRQSIHGVTVLGSLDEINEISRVEDVDEIIIAISAASSSEMRRIVTACEGTGLPCKTVPGIGELIEGRVSVRAIRKIRYEDLLGRRQVRLNLGQIGKYLNGKRVMVTGGCGSIGSELCRQLVRFKPRKLIVVDVNESGLYDIEMDFRARFVDIDMFPVLCPIQNGHVMSRLFEQERPEVVFHAAAFKHVPMMEHHPWEAVFNNIVGTQSLLELCYRYGVNRCVVVSTDKAVRPTNVMGASKRVCEMLAQLYALELGARNMCVRFGNVIYSAGSVVPLFRKQIEHGGPVTLTHKDVMRYFMTIPEASQLILQSGAIGQGGEIFILKMGTPVRIADMARDLIRMSGFEPDREIEVKEIGLRPGEKLIEELITEGEGILETEHSEIMVLKAQRAERMAHGGGHPGETLSGTLSELFHPDGIEERGFYRAGGGGNTECGGQYLNGLTLKKMRKHIKRLVNYAEAGDGEKIREELRKIVPEYQPQSAEGRAHGKAG
ncbi:RmlD substrate binding domain protein [delta proteobacterium NaphS2]|nr:RmlD substrate binding domain protein [delta proteobacterium NaphS2]